MMKISTTALLAVAATAAPIDTVGFNLAQDVKTHVPIDDFTFINSTEQKLIEHDNLLDQIQVEYDKWQSWDYDGVQNVINKYKTTLNNRADELRKLITDLTNKVNRNYASAKATHTNDL